MNPIPFLLTAAALAVVLPGCGSTEEAAGDQADSVPPRQEQLPVAKEPPPKRLEFETRTDTVTAVHGAQRKNTGAARGNAEVRYMVQIGAFKDPRNATAVQTAAKKRYQLPVLNDFFPGLSLYQIRIGFFDTRESARAFREKMRQEYPADYGDSWVVQLTR